MLLSLLRFSGCSCCMLCCSGKRASGAAEAKAGSPQHVFLTGVTGFLGIKSCCLASVLSISDPFSGCVAGGYLLHELLFQRSSDTVFHCLVRPDGESSIDRHLARGNRPTDSLRLAGKPGEKKGDSKEASKEEVCLLCRLARFRWMVAQTCEHCGLQLAARGMKRLVSTLQERGVWDESFAARVKCVPGSLGAVRFGLGRSLTSHFAFP